MKAKRCSLHLFFSRARIRETEKRDREAHAQGPKPAPLRGRIFHAARSLAFHASKSCFVAAYAAVFLRVSTLRATRPHLRDSAENGAPAEPSRLPFARADTQLPPPVSGSCLARIVPRVAACVRRCAARGLPRGSLRNRAFSAARSAYGSSKSAGPGGASSRCGRAQNTSLRGPVTVRPLPGLQSWQKPR